MHQAASLGRQAAIVLLTAAAPPWPLAQPGSSPPVVPVAHAVHRGRSATGARTQSPAARAAAERRHVEGRRNHRGAQAQSRCSRRPTRTSRSSRRASCSAGTTSPTTRTSSQSFSYLFERGGKREKRTLVARGHDRPWPSGPRWTPSGSWRFRPQQAFINVLLAKSTLEPGAREPEELLDVVDVNRERLRAGDLAEADF